MHRKRSQFLFHWTGFVVGRGVGSVHVEGSERFYPTFDRAGRFLNAPARFRQIQTFSAVVTFCRGNRLSGEASAWNTDGLILWNFEWTQAFRLAVVTDLG